MLDFIINNFNILAQAECGLFSVKEFEYVSGAYKAILVIIPSLVIVLCTIDIAKAVVAQDDNAIKKAQSSAIKRIVAGVIVFFIPVVLNLILGIKYTDNHGNRLDLGKECVSDVAE